MIGKEYLHCVSDHCIDLLRQVIMCHADVGLIVFDDMGPKSSPVPRFSTDHKCRNFTAITEWVNNHDADNRPLFGRL